MQYFPLFADLKGRAVLLVGAGDVATRKAESLLQAGADVRVVARELAPAFLDWQNEGRIQWLARAFQPEHLQDVFLVVSATGDAEVDSQVFKAAQARHLLCNTVDDPQRCSFITPAVIDRSPIQVAISSSGTSPVLIRHWRQRIEALLPQHTGTLADIAGRWRPRVQERLGTVRERRHFWETLFASHFDALVARGDIAAAEAELARQLDGQAARRGEVVVVHADPDDPGLLTLHALRALQAADLVLYEARISEQVRHQIRKDAQRSCLAPALAPHGQFDGTGSQHAAHVAVRLRDEARQGKRVVWLRCAPQNPSDDSTCVQVLAHADVPLRIIPGIPGSGIDSRSDEPRSQQPAPAAALPISVPFQATPTAISPVQRLRVAAPQHLHRLYRRKHRHDMTLRHFQVLQNRKI